MPGYHRSLTLYSLLRPFRPNLCHCNVWLISCWSLRVGRFVRFRRHRYIHIWSRQLRQQWWSIPRVEAVRLLVVGEVLDLAFHAKYVVSLGTWLNGVITISTVTVVVRRRGQGSHLRPVLSIKVLVCCMLLCPPRCQSPVLVSPRWCHS